MGIIYLKTFAFCCKNVLRKIPPCSQRRAYINSFFSTNQIDVSFCCWDIPHWLSFCKPVYDETTRRDYQLYMQSLSVYAL